MTWSLSYISPQKPNLLFGFSFHRPTQSRVASARRWAPPLQAYSLNWATPYRQSPLGHPGNGVDCPHQHPHRQDRDQHGGRVCLLISAALTSPSLRFTSPGGVQTWQKWSFTSKDDSNSMTYWNTTQVPFLRNSTFGSNGLTFPPPLDRRSCTSTSLCYAAFSLLHSPRSHVVLSACTSSEKWPC